MILGRFFLGILFFLPVVSYASSCPGPELAACHAKNEQSQVCQQLYNCENLSRCIAEATAEAMKRFQLASDSYCLLPLPKGLCGFFGNLFMGERQSPGGWAGQGNEFVNGANSCYDKFKKTAVYKNDLKTITPVRFDPTSRGAGFSIVDTADGTASSFASGGLDANYTLGEDGNKYLDFGTGNYIDKNGVFHGKDGSSAFGLPNGAIMNGVLNGTSAADTIAGSPFAKKNKLGKSEYDKMMKSLSGSGNGGVVDGKDSGTAGAGNKSKAGENLLDPFALTAEELAAAGELSPEELAAKEAAEKAAREAAALAAAKAGEAGNGDGTGKNGAFGVGGDGRGLASSSGRGRYGDRTIFQMVSDQYKKKKSSLLGVEQFVREKSKEQRSVAGIVDNIQL